jgi:organic hydroperoxide reductase OsmC/OhrA
MTTTSAPQAHDDKHVRVRIRPNGGYRFVASFPDLPNAAPIMLDEPPPLGDGAGPNPAGALAAAIGSCLAASLTFCLRRARVEGHVEADAEATLVRNAQGRFRIEGVSVALSVRVSAEDKARLDRCRALFEDFCIVTESVRHGIPVTLAIDAEAAAA